jgi:hypothetical protein
VPSLGEPEKRIIVTIIVTLFVLPVEDTAGGEKGGANIPLLGGVYTIIYA